MTLWCLDPLHTGTRFYGSENRDTVIFEEDRGEEYEARYNLRNENENEAKGTEIMKGSQDRFRDANSAE